MRQKYQKFKNDVQLLHTFSKNIHSKRLISDQQEFFVSCRVPQTPSPLL